MLLDQVPSDPLCTGLSVHIETRPKTTMEAVPAPARRACDDGRPTKGDERRGVSLPRPDVDC